MENKQALAQAAIETIAMVCGQELLEEKSYKHNRTEIPDAVAVRLEMTGDIVGHVTIRFTEENAKKAASAMMMGMPIDMLDEMSLSALAELGNMIMGNAATIFSTKGILIDITPPTVCRGNLTIAQSFAQNICVPLSGGDITIELDVAVKV